VNIRQVAVVGSGLMGRGIAHAAATGGFSTVLQDVSPAALEAALTRIRTDLDEGVRRGKLAREDADAAFSRIRTASSLEEAAEGTDFAIEAVPEQMELKTRTFARLDALCPPGVVLATNTSALVISEISAATEHPDRVIGMHFFNPVPKMKLVEVVKTADTGLRTVETTRKVAASMGKETVVVRESPGFVTSRINATIGNEAFLMLEQGVASAEDIDKATKLGLNHPMGPFELVDLVGLDTRLAVLRLLHEKLGDKYRPAALLERYVAEGRLGRKTGRGVYDYGDTGDRK
jgi:3-hydroxybutyryl-CoA dehydrogenase